MAFASKQVVVLGGTGYVGTGVVLHFLQEGAAVIVVSRDQRKIDELKARVSANGASTVHLDGVIDRGGGEGGTRGGETALKGKPIDHVVSILGFASVHPGGPTAPATKELQAGLDASLFNTFNAAKVFLPELKDREGASCTLTSGGLSHYTPDSSLFAASIVASAVSALTNGLAAETKNDKVRVNTVCIHISIAQIGGDKNQFGFPATDTRKLAPIYLAVAKGTAKGKIICVQDIEKTLQSLA